MIVNLDTVTVSTDMPNEAYHADKTHISRSTAHRYRGPVGGRAQRYAEVKGKSLFAGNAATGFGTLVDSACEAIISGVDWRSRVVIPPAGVLAADGSRRGKAYIEWKNSLPHGASECSAADFGKTADIIESIREHDAANQLLEAATHSQYSVFWTDEDGHQRKARADGVTKTCWFDLKTTSSEWRELKYSFTRYGYNWQDVWYRDAATAAGFEPFQFKFIVVQTFAPHDVKVLTIPAEVLDAAAIEIRETLELIRSRRETGVYVDPTYHAVEELMF